MSADNYYVIRKHPNGGFAAVMGFESDNNYPEAKPSQTSWPSVGDAWDWADTQYSEYGVSVHPECRALPRCDFSGLFISQCDHCRSPKPHETPTTYTDPDGFIYQEVIK